MRKAFYIIAAIFGISLLLLVSYGFTQSSWFVPSNASKFTGLLPLANALEKISGVDAFVTLLSGIGTIITGILKRVLE